MNQAETDTSSADSGIHSSSMPSPIYGPLDILKKEPVSLNENEHLFNKIVGKNGYISHFGEDFDYSQFSALNIYNSNIHDKDILHEKNQHIIDKATKINFAKPSYNKIMHNINFNASKTLYDDLDLESLSDFKFQPTCLSRVSSLEAHEMSLSESPLKQKTNYSKSLILLEKMKSVFEDEKQDQKIREFNERKMGKNIKNIKRQKPSDGISLSSNLNQSTLKKKGLKMSLLDLSDEEIQILKTISLEQLQKFNIKTMIPKDSETQRKSFKEIFYWRRSQPDSLNDTENGNQHVCNRIFGVSLPTCIKNEEFFEKLNEKHENQCTVLLKSIYHNAGLIFTPNKSLKCPKFVFTCTDYLLKNGLNQIGIFRVNGSRSRIEELKKKKVPTATLR